MGVSRTPHVSQTRTIRLYIRDSDMVLPLELVREIIGYVLVTSQAALSDEPGTNTKPDWTLVSSLSLVSKTYRTLALEAWFRVLFITSPADLLFLQHSLPEVRTSWAQELHCVRKTGLDPWDLDNFKRLKTIRLDWPSPHVLDPDGNLQNYPFVNLPANIVVLDIRGLTWPSPFVFQAITLAFSDLRILRLDQHKVWCGLCHTCSTVKLAEPIPHKLAYQDGLGLPVHYARSLSPLQHLHTISIKMPVWPGTHICLNPNDPGKELWTGECDRCVGIMYDDEAFRERWTERKRGLLSLNPAGRRLSVYTLNRLR
ncbi:hypothetical protein B0H10DRAFT_1266101 [Mycena sp. CBHHK59/15]|nr:hypothetical protein B0H10DRAFT_1266101 [Mycena sp. CBHHK59/15]